MYTFVEVLQHLADMECTAKESVVDQFLAGKMDGNHELSIQAAAHKHCPIEDVIVVQSLKAVHE